MVRRSRTARAWRRALTACLLLAASAAAAQPWPHGPRAPRDGAWGAPPGAFREGRPEGPLDPDRQRMREQLREQLRNERGGPGPGPGGPRGWDRPDRDDRPRLSPEERQALREQLREQRRGRGP